MVFHHGAFEAVGKDSILQLLGATASGIEWNTVSGQNVINVAPGHFVTTNAVEYGQSVNYEHASAGIANATYSMFNNTPDERYPNVTLLTEVNEQRTMLFASNYTNSGSQHILGYALQRQGWNGRVVMYQPGEYQPQALDDLDGNNFQILANAILYAAGQESSGGGTDGTTSTTSTTTTSATTSSTSGSGTTVTTGATTTSGSAGTGGSTSVADTGAANTTSPSATGGDEVGGTSECDGCDTGCRAAARASNGVHGFSGLWLVAWGIVGRRRRS